MIVLGDTCGSRFVFVVILSVCVAYVVVAAVAGIFVANESGDSFPPQISSSSWLVFWSGSQIIIVWMIHCLMLML
jgi:hypothetical protein